MSHSPTIAQQIRGWHQDIILMDRQPIARHQAAIRVYAHNWLTSPSRPMTDQEHRACRTLARRCWKELQNFGGWHETDSGFLWI